MNQLAVILSRIFEPMIVLSVLLILATVQAKTDGLFLLFAFIVIILPIALLRFWFVRARGLDWDIKDRKKRIAPLSVFLLFVFVDLMLVRLWQNTLLTDLFTLFLMWGFGYLAITLVWKISGHTSVLMLAALLILDWYGLGMWPILFVVPLVAWARIVTKNHSLGQAIGGIVYSTVLHEVWKGVF